MHITPPKPGWGMKREREIGLFQTSLIDQEHNAKWSQENGINHGVCRKLDGVSDGEEWNYRDSVAALASAKEEKDGAIHRGR